MVAKHFLRLIAMLALVLAPISMMSGFAAMAHPGPSATASHHDQSRDQSAHCAEMSAKASGEDSSFPPGDCLSDCAMTCSALPGIANLCLVAAPPLGIIQPRQLADRLHGLSPESADPPPRAA